MELYKRRGMLCPVAATSDFQSVVTAATPFDTSMAAGELYVFTCSVNCYIKQGATPTASAADASMFVPAGMPVVIDGDQGAKLSVIRQTTDGVATLQKMDYIR